MCDEITSEKSIDEYTEFTIRKCESGLILDICQNIDDYKQEIFDMYICLEETEMIQLMRLLQKVLNNGQKENTM